jgi:chromosome segregation ATPase
VYGTWADVLTTRSALDAAIAKLREANADRANRLAAIEAEMLSSHFQPVDSIHAECAAARDEVELCRRKYEDTRDLFFAGEQAMHDLKQEAAAMKAEDLAKASFDLAREQKTASDKAGRFNGWVGFFVIVSAMGTVAQAIAAWR